MEASYPANEGGDVEMANASAPYRIWNDTDKIESVSSTPISWRLQISAFFTMTKMYFVENSNGRWMLLGLIVLMLLSSTVRVAFSFLARDFWSALGDGEVDQFYAIVRNFLVALILLAPINVLYRYQQDCLALQWRTWMTQRILHLYSSHRVYYQLELWSPSLNSESRIKQANASSPPMDNPDQRIAEDVKSFTETSLSIFLTMALAMVDLVAFSVILYTVEPSLFFSIIAFATFGTVTTLIIGKRLVRLHFDRLSLEAHFRYSLVRMREYAESIAFFRGEPQETALAQQKFDKLMDNAYDVVRTQRNLDFFTTIYNYLTWILPIVVIAPQYFQGLAELGVIQQAAVAFGHVLDDLSVIIDNFESLSAFSASVGRLHQFLRAVDEVSSGMVKTGDVTILALPSTDGLLKTNIRVQKEQKGSARSIPQAVGVCETSEESPFALSVQLLTLFTPDHERRLIESVSFDVKWGQRLLIVGPSGVGKSSLLRAIAGLWRCESGKIERPPIADIYFLPQKPCESDDVRGNDVYGMLSHRFPTDAPLGTLKDILLYPQNALVVSESSYISAQQLLDVLTKVDLIDHARRVGNGDPLQGLDKDIDWSHVLSLGEQQRLAFARILVNHPKLVILDESTSALDVESERRMYELLEELGDETTYISVGHRPTLLAYHSHRLVLSKPNDDTQQPQPSYTYGEVLEVPPIPHQNMYY